MDDVADFELTLQCMKNVHFSDQEIVQILDSVVAILNMGNVEFGVNQQDKVSPAADSKDAVMMTARLLGVEWEKLVFALTMKKQLLGREIIESNLNLDQAY